MDVGGSARRPLRDLDKDSNRFPVGAHAVPKRHEVVRVHRAHLVLQKVRLGEIIDVCGDEVAGAGLDGVGEHLTILDRTSHQPGGRGCRRRQLHAENVETYALQGRSAGRDVPISLVFDVPRPDHTETVGTGTRDHERASDRRGENVRVKEKQRIRH